VNHKLVASIMTELQIHGLPKRRKYRRNPDRFAKAKDLVHRNFRPTIPNELWATDMTEHPTREGKLYCCVVLDAFSRKAVGWSIDRRRDTVLVNSAVDMAAQSRSTKPETILHSDHGVQLAYWGFTQNADRQDLHVSMGTIGDCDDNAMIEALWGRMQTGLLYRKSWLRGWSWPRRWPNTSTTSITTNDATHP
jgi:putative transposase